MLQKELAKRLKARYDTKMGGNEWMEVSSDGIPLCRIKYNGQFLSNADQNLSDEYRSKIADIQDEMQCPAGYLAMRVEKRNAANGNTYCNYCFSVKKCKACPMRETCKVGKSKCHTYSVTCVNDAHKARLEFESSEEFSNKMRIRHRIEEKNGEMKTAHGFRRADSAGLVAMRLQAYFTAMVVNMKRIIAVNPG